MLTDTAQGQHLEDALAILLGDRQSSEQERAVLICCVQVVADGLNDIFKEPRTKEVFDRLDSIKDLANRLDRCISQLDPESHDYLEQEPNRLYAPELAAAVAGLIARGDGLRPLQALAKVACSAKELFHDLGAEDRGGSTTMVGQMRGRTPQQWLVRECATLLLQCRGEAAVSGTTDGNLHRLSLAVWGYATRSATEPALERHVKRTATALKKRQAKIREGSPAPNLPDGSAKNA